MSDAVVPALCRDITAQTVANVVGHAVPAAHGEKDSYELGGVAVTETNCIYGDFPVGSLFSPKTPNLKNTVEIAYMTYAKSVPPLGPEMRALAKAGEKVQTVRGLGANIAAFYYSGKDISVPGLSIEGIVAANGTKEISLTVHTAVPVVRLVDLSKLAISKFF